MRRGNRCAGCRPGQLDLRSDKCPTGHIDTFSAFAGSLKIGGSQLSARQLRESIEIRFQAAVAELLDALQLPAKIVNLELAAVQPISFAAASNRRVIGSMNEFVRQIESDLMRTSDPLHLALRLGETPMSAVGSKAYYGLPNEVARDLLMSWEH